MGSVVNENPVQGDELRLDIDRLQLDKEWLNQPQQYYIWAVKVADAQLAFNSAKSKMDLVSANLDTEIRNNPEDYGVAKVTKDAMDAVIAQQPSYLAAQSAVNKARHTLSLAEAAVQALEHRKRALTLLVELWIREYYADPNPKAITPQGSDFEKEAIRNRGARRIRERPEDMETQD